MNAWITVLSTYTGNSDLPKQIRGLFAFHQKTILFCSQLFRKFLQARKVIWLCVWNSLWQNESKQILQKRNPQPTRCYQTAFNICTLQNANINSAIKWLPKNFTFLSWHFTENSHSELFSLQYYKTVSTCTSEYMKVNLFKLRRMIWRYDWSSQLSTQPKQLWN